MGRACFNTHRSVGLSLQDVERCYGVDDRAFTDFTDYFIFAAGRAAWLGVPSVAVIVTPIAVALIALGAEAALAVRARPISNDSTRRRF